MSKVEFQIFTGETFIDMGLFQMGRELCDPGHTFGPAKRNHFLFHFVISGAGTLYADNAAGRTETYKVRSGQGFLLFPHQTTTYTADVRYPWDYVWLEFDGMKAAELVKAAGLSVDHPVYKAKNHEMREQMKDEMLYILAHREDNPLHLIGHLYLFLDYFLQSTTGPYAHGNDRMSDFYVSETINYVEQNFQNDISVDDMAARVSLNRSYFSKLFKRATGQSPQAFLIQYRMAKAVELLKLTSLSVKDVGSAVGYPNQFNFSRVFRSAYGASPAQWRKEHGRK